MQHLCNSFRDTPSLPAAPHPPVHRANLGYQRSKKNFNALFLKKPKQPDHDQQYFKPVGNTGGEVGQKQRGDVQWKGRGPEQGGSPGARYVPQRKTRVDGERIWRPYAPLWLKDLGNR